MKKLIYILPVFALLLASCEDYYLEKQLGYETTIEDVRNFTYTLTAADYSAIATNATNIAAALELGKSDSTGIDSTYYDLLQAVGEQKYFEGKITPDLCIPAFLVQKYPQLSTGTLCKVFYNIASDKPAWANDFQEVSTIVPTSTLTLSAIPAHLEANVSEELRTEGHKYIVLYENAKTAIYQYKNGAFSSYSNSSLKLTILTKSDYTTTMGLSTAEFKNDDPQTYLDVYFTAKYPYAQVGDTHTIIYVYSNEADGISGQTVICDYVYDGEEWSQALPYFEESMTFDMKEVWEANLSIFLKEPFVGNGQGDFVIQDVLLPEPLTYVWKYDSRYGMKASAFANNTKYTTDSWLVSPAVKLKNAKKPALIFDQAQRYAGQFTEEMSVLVSTDYAGDVTKATWEKLEWNLNEDGTPNVPSGADWTFQSSGDFDLSKYVNQTIYIAFRYTSSSSAAATWEIQNILIHEVEVEE